VSLQSSGDATGRGLRSLGEGQCLGQLVLEETLFCLAWESLLPTERDSWVGHLPHQR
jgi:hypothetical protein